MSLLISQSKLNHILEWNPEDACKWDELSLNSARSYNADIGYKSRQRGQVVGIEVRKHGNFRLTTHTLCIGHEHTKHSKEPETQVSVNKRVSVVNR